MGGVVGGVVGWVMGGVVGGGVGWVVGGVVGGGVGGVVGWVVGKSELLGEILGMAVGEGSKDSVCSR